MQATLQELFPSWGAVKRNKEVVKFCTGLISDPKPLVGYVCGLYIECNLEKMTTGEWFSTQGKLFESLYNESQVELPGEALHNPWINYCKQSTSEPFCIYYGESGTQVYLPSQFYVFD